MVTPSGAGVSRRRPSTSPDSLFPVLPEIICQKATRARMPTEPVDAVELKILPQLDFSLTYRKKSRKAKAPHRRSTGCASPKTASSRIPPEIPFSRTGRRGGKAGIPSPRRGAPKRGASGIPRQGKSRGPLRRREPCRRDAWVLDRNRD